MKIVNIGVLLLSVCGIVCGMQRLAAEEDEEIVRVTFRALAWDRTIKDLYVRGEEGFQRVIIPSGGLSLSYEYVGPPALRFYRKGPTDENGIETWLPATDSRNVSDGQRVLFVLRAHPGQPDRYGLAMHEAASGDFPPGAYQFFNFSQHPLACRLAEIRFEVPPGGSRIVAMDPPAENQFVTFLAHEVDGEWQLLFKTKWAWYPNKRSYVFVSPDPETRETSLKIIEETVGWRQ